MPEEKHVQMVKIDKEISALVEKFDTIAKALRTYIKENSEKIGGVDEKLKNLEMRVSKIETTLDRINDYNAKIAKEIENSGNLVTGGFYDLKSRIGDVELNVLSSMKKKKEEKK